MSSKLDVKHFLNIEKEYNLYEDSIDGINYWVYSRFIIWNELIVEPQLELGKAHSSEKVRIYEAVKILFDLIKNTLINPNKAKKNIDVLFISHPRRVLKKGYYECIYTEELAKHYKNCAVLEQPYQWKHLYPIAQPNIIYGDYFLLKKGIYLFVYSKILRRKYKKILRKIEEKVAQVMQEIERIYDISLNRKRIINEIAIQIIFYKANVKSVKKLLTRLKPKVVVEVVGYNPFCMLINEICKDLNISTIELQHGVLDEIAYAYMTDRKIKQIPEHVFLFSKLWERYIKFPINNRNIHAMGYPYFEREVRKAKQIQEYNDDKVNILFISQGTIGKKLSNLAVELRDKIDSNQFRILFKLHPGEIAIWKEEYKSLKNSDIIVIDDKKYSLYEYFATCQIQVGVSSTALYEGLGFEIRTYIYHIETSEYARYLCDMGYAEYIENSEELYVNILYNEAVNYKVDELWKTCALDNMIGKIDEICRKERKKF